MENTLIFFNYSNHNNFNQPFKFILKILRKKMFVKIFGSFRSSDSTLIFSGHCFDKKTKKCSLIIEDFHDEIFFEVKKEDWKKRNMKTLVDFLIEKDVEVFSSKLKKKKTLYGFFDAFCFELKVLNFNKKINLPFVLKIHHEDVDISTKFLSEKNATFCNWIRLKNFQSKKLNENCLLLIAKTEDIFSCEEKTKVFPTFFFFDIETERNDILQISIVISRKEIEEIFLLTLYKIKEIEGVRVIFSKTEKKILENFFKIISKFDPDILSGFNIIEFDWRVILDACDKNFSKSELKKIFTECSRTKLFESVIRRYQIENNEFSKTNVTFLHIEGRSNIDIIQHVKKNFNLASNTLKYVSSFFLKDKTKMSMEYVEINLMAKLARVKNDKKKLKDHLIEMFSFDYLSNIKCVLKEKNVTRMISLGFELIGKYCIIDSILCFDLMNELSILSFCEEISKLTFIPLEDVLCRGYGIRFLNLLFNFSSKKNIVLDKAEGIFETINKKETFQGGHVIEPKRGLHQGVFILDFRSLYPSIIDQFNLCFTTFTKEGDFPFHKKRRGIVPTICKYLINERKKIKKKLKVEKNENEANSLNLRQKALKITSNSIYGILGSKRSARPFLLIAETTTEIGRFLLKKIEEFIQKKGFVVIYGDTDSCVVKMPTSKNPVIIFDTLLLIEHILNNSKKPIKIFKSLISVSKENEIEMKRFIKDEYGIPFKNNMDLSKYLFELVEKIGTQLSKVITFEVNKLTKLSFQLEFEECFEQYFLIEKKSYVGKSYFSNKLISKGTLLTKKNYSVFEKKVFKKVLKLIFERSKDILEDIFFTILEAFQTYHSFQDFVVSSSFQSFAFYANKNKEKKFVDKDGEIFTTLKSFDERFTFKGALPHVFVGLKMIERGQMVYENSRIEYVFCECSSTKKKDKAFDLPFCLQNKGKMFVDKLEYLERLMNPLTKIMSLSSVGLANSIRSLKEIQKQFILKRKCIEELKFLKKEFNKSCR